MKLFFASDLHGDLNATKQVLKHYQDLNCDQLILLGDLLNHGPRNKIPQDYQPSQVASMLNEHASEIIAVRGNCDSEVDQMLLDFPLMQAHHILLLKLEQKLKRLFLTHGHLYSSQSLTQSEAFTQTMPFNFGKEDIICHGHTHIPQARFVGENFIFNPGSTTFPKENHLKSFGLYHEGKFEVRSLENPQEVILKTSLMDKK